MCKPYTKWMAPETTSALRGPAVFGAFVFGFLASAPVFAQDNNFRVALEVLVFLQLDPEASTEEIRMNPPELPVPRIYPAPVELPESGVGTPQPPPGVLALTRAQYTLDGIWLSMRRSAEYRPLAQFAWTMPSDWSGEPVEVRFSTLSSASLPFSGLATLEEERFVHLSLDVRLPDASGDGSVFQLVERRRLLLGEIHYFDHPEFGVLARLFRYRPRPQAEPED